MGDRLGIYPGSFDPPTYGHLDLMNRAAKLFDTLVIAVARNNEKNATFSVPERVEMLEIITKDIPNVEVSSFEGLTVDFARERNAIALVRGLRVVSDFEYEITIAVANQKLNPDVDTMCLMPSENFLLVSSKIVREIAHFGGDVSHFVPPEVDERLQQKLGKR